MRFTNGPKHNNNLVQQQHRMNQNTVDYTTLPRNNQYAAEWRRAEMIADCIDATNDISQMTAHLERSLGQTIRPEDVGAVRKNNETNRFELH